ncbi:MAG: glycosyltransferase [Bacteroidales bacterium]|nr:glycosyltransferase [Bacteroidales bacterium]
MKKRIYISVINDLVTDQRVQRIAGTLSKSDYLPVLLGRKLRKSPRLRLEGIVYKRFRLIFNNGFLFYAFFNIRLFLYLITRRGKVILLANDLDTLPANYLASVLRGWKLIYDSHEYFTEVPELSDRKFVRNFWLQLEKILVPRVNLAYTVNETLAKMYSAKYGLKFHVIRNVPGEILKPIDYVLPDDFQEMKIILYQGAINKDRGLEGIIKLMSRLDEIALIIAGDGDILDTLKQLVKDEKLTHKVYFTGRLCPQRLRALTQQADLGISLERKSNLNYYYALPNKIFDYIQANVPVVCSGFPEMKRIIDDYNVGMTVKSDNKELLFEILLEALYNKEKRKEWQENCTLASSVLNWEIEQKRLISIYTDEGLVFEG